jgi:hypothetical protein
VVNLRKRDHLEGLCIGERIILKWVFMIDWGWGDMEWIDLSQDRDKWQASFFVNVIMNIWVP